MSDRQALIDWLRHWKHEVPTTREREEMIEAMRDAATALEEAQGVPREPTQEMLDAVSNVATDRYLHAMAARIWKAMFDAAPAARDPVPPRRKVLDSDDDEPYLTDDRGYQVAPAAPTREPVSAATLRDEQDAKRLYYELLYAVATKHPGESRHETALRYIREREDTARHDTGAKAALAEPKR